MSKTEYPMASNVIRLQSYLLPPDEAVFLDWLIAKAIAFGFKPFYYSYRRIHEELRIKRRKLDAILLKFSELKILKVYTKGNTQINAKVTYFEVSIEGVWYNLHQIINPESGDYFKQWENFLDTAMKGIKPQKPTKSAMKLADEVHSLLVAVYNERIRMYNKGDLTCGVAPQRQKRESSLPKKESNLKSLSELAKSHGKDAIRNAFIALVDKILTKEIKCAHPLDYFFTKREDYYPVFNDYLDYYNKQYSHPK